MKSEEIIKVWSELLTYDRLQPDRAVQDLIKKVMPMVGSSEAMWIGSVKNKEYLGCPVAEMLEDWVITGSEKVTSGSQYDIDKEESYRLYMETRAKYGADTDILTKGALKGAGQSRAHLRSDSLSDEEWQKHWVYTEFNKKRGIGDALHVVVTIDEECESWVVFYKPDGEGYFTEEDKSIAFNAIMGAAEWLRKIQLFRGAVLPSKRVLSAKEQSVLKLIIKGLRDIEIAEICNFSTATARSHTTSIYRKLKVGGKAELMSIFI